VLTREKEKEHRPIYFVSWTLQGAEVRYQKIEKVALAVVMTVRWLRYYFQNFQVVVRTDLPIKQVLQKMHLAGRMMKWAIELSEYGLLFEGMGLVRPQVLVDFVAELAPSDDEDVKEGSGGWILSVDGAPNVQGSGAGIILEGSDGVLVEHSLKSAFQASNNQAEYEALLAGMRLAIDMGSIGWW